MQFCQGLPARVSPSEALTISKTTKCRLAVPMHSTMDGYAHLIGITADTHIIICGQVVTATLDLGASLTVMTLKLLKMLDKNFESKLTKCFIKEAHAYGSSLKPLGIYKTHVIFPHPQGSIVAPMEFVIFDSHHSQTILIGREWCVIYGIDIRNSKNYFTIGKYPQRFALDALRDFNSPALIQAATGKGVTPPTDHNLSEIDHLLTHSGDGSVFEPEFEIALQSASFNAELTLNNLMC